MAQSAAESDHNSDNNSDNRATTQLLLARHGQSTWNADGRWQGQADPPLSDLGRDQAFAAAQRIGTVDLIVSSPQDRALTTARIISDSIGVGPVIKLDGLMERDAGPWSGLTTREIETAHPGWIESGQRPEGYESDDSVFERADGALRAIVMSNPASTVLVVCHGGVIHTMEGRLGVTAGRVPNLSGRILSAVGTGDFSWQVGEALQLLDDDEVTGGQHQHRV